MRSDGKYRLSAHYQSAWSRVRKLVSIIGDQMFQSDEEPFKIQKNHNKKKDMITILDLAFLTLFSLYMLIEECWKYNILLIGITKDTIAHEFKNHVIPICANNNMPPLRQIRIA
jgi:hypothetical protein